MAAMNMKCEQIMMLIRLVAIVTAVLISRFPGGSEACWAENGTSSTQLIHIKFHKVVSHYSFFSGNPKWPTPSKYRLTYAFPQGFPSNGIPAIAQAFNHWASKTPFTFTQVANNSPSDLKISFQRGSHGDGAPFDGKGGTLAHAFAPQNGWLHFDGDDSFSIGAVPNSFDLQSVAVHEIGHLLGLDHTNVTQAIMYPFISSGTVKTTLQPDDINGIKALYGF